MGTAQDVFDAVESHAMSSGLFDSVNTAEPKSAPGSGITCSIWIQSIAPIVDSGLASTSVRLELSVRIYTSMIAEPDAGIDPGLTAAMLSLMADYSADFALSIITTAPTVRNIDLLGAHGTPLSADAGYINIDGGLYRVLTLTVPIILNDAFTQAA